jgi:hypothetical protein
MKQDPRGRFIDDLKQLVVDAGSPKQAKLVLQMPEVLNTSTVSELLKGKGPTLPPWERIEAFVIACVRTGLAQGRPMPPEKVVIDQWRKRHDLLAVAVDQAAYRSQSASGVEGDGTELDQGRSQDSRRLRFGAVPPRAGAFQQRGAARVLHADAAKDDLDGTATSVLVGLGGVGKTQIAADHAHAQWSQGRVQLLLWVTARTREAIVTAYAEVAQELQDQDSSFPEKAARRLLNWLAETDLPWLIVLDDLQDPADLSGLWPPQVPAGLVLVTTRRRDAAMDGHGRHIVEIDLFSPEEARAYLIDKMPNRTGAPISIAEIDALAKAVWYLPLALAQAAGYLLNKPLLTLAEYRAKLADRRNRLDSLMPRQGELPDEHERTVAATWSLSIEAADRLEPVGVARPMMELVSMLDPAGVPLPVLVAECVVNHVSSRLLRHLDDEALSSGLECLRRFSLLDFNFDPDRSFHEIRVHALVQRAVHDTLEEPEFAYVATMAANGLQSTWSHSETDREMTRSLRANTAFLQDIAECYLYDRKVHPVLFELVGSFAKSGYLDLAIAYTKRMHAKASAKLGANHRDTNGILLNLATFRGHAGDPRGAAVETRILIAEQMRTLGPDHIETLTSRGNLANWIGMAGDIDAAISAHIELVGDKSRVLGVDHRDTLIARSHLASWRGESGDPDSAIAENRKLLEDMRRALGPDHPDILIVRGNLARWTSATSDPLSAIAALDELLSDQLRIVGPDHYSTLVTRHRIALYIGESGDVAAASDAAAELLLDCLRILGENHPHTLDVRRSCDHWDAPE